MQDKLLNGLILTVSLLLIALIASWVYFGMRANGAGFEIIKLEQQSFLVMLFGVLTALFAVIFFLSVIRGDAPLVETHWGGIGGSLGGWRLSKSLVYFLGALAFGAMAVVSLGENSGYQPGDSGQAEGDRAAQNEASSQAATAE